MSSRPRPSAKTSPENPKGASAVDLLKKASLSRTKSREALLKVLLEKHGPFSVEELHSFIKKQRVDIVTVYRCLTAFEKMHLVKRCDFGDGIARYEMNLHSHHHHHVICRNCRKAENIEDCEVARLEALVAERGYLEVSHNLEFFGICRDCQLE